MIKNLKESNEKVSKPSVHKSTSIFWSILLDILILSIQVENITDPLKLLQ